MSIFRLTRVHNVTVLVQNPTTTRSGSVTRNYAPGVPARVLPCRVTDTISTELRQLGVRGMQISHVVFFDFDPAIDERNRLSWNFAGVNTIFRLIGLPINVQGQNRLWIQPAVAKTEDNTLIEVQ